MSSRMYLRLSRCSFSRLPCRLRYDWTPSHFLEMASLCMLKLTSIDLQNPCQGNPKAQHQIIQLLCSLPLLSLNKMPHTPLGKKMSHIPFNDKEFCHSLVQDARPPQDEICRFLGPGGKQAKQRLVQRLRTMPAAQLPSKTVSAKISTFVPDQGCRLMHAMSFAVSF